jgi:hypothetical protein
MNNRKKLVIISAPFLPVFWIQEILARIWIIGSVPKKRIWIHTNVYGLLTRSYLFGGIEMQDNSKMYLTL